MIKTTLVIEGMACGMCEAHINDTIRRAFPVKKVKSAFSKGRTEIITENALDEAKLREIIVATGYVVTSVQTQLYEKKGVSLLKK